MEHFLEIYKEYEGNNKDLIVYATELSYSKELTEDLEDQYEDMLEVLYEELEEQPEPDNPMHDSDTEHKLFENELL